MSYKSQTGATSATPETVCNLHTAALQGHIEAVKAILDTQTVSVDAQDADGTTALILACANNQLRCVQELLKYGADVSLTRRSGCGPLFLASQGGFAGIVRELLGCSPSNSGITNANENKSNVKIYCHPLLVAAQNGHVTCAQLLLDNHQHSLLRTGSSSHLDDIRLVDGATALFLASQSGHTSLIQLLLKRGATVDTHRKDGTTALFIAAQMGHARVCKCLLQAGATVDLPREDGVTPLLKAAQKGHTDVMEVLLQYGPRIDLVGSGDSPLHLAALFGHSKVCHMLLVRGADPTQLNKDGQTAIDMAREARFDHIVALLDYYTARRKGLDGSLLWNTNDRFLSFPRPPSAPSHPFAMSTETSSVMNNTRHSLFSWLGSTYPLNNNLEQSTLLSLAPSSDFRTNFTPQQATSAITQSHNRLRPACSMPIHPPPPPLPPPPLRSQIQLQHSHGKI